MRRRSSLAVVSSISTTPTGGAGCSRWAVSAIVAPVPMHPSFEAREGAPDEVLAADALVMSSVNDSHPQAPLEAMA